METSNSSQVKFRILFLFCLLVATSLSCSLLSDIRETTGEARQTAESLATTVQQGRDALATGQAVATQVLGSEAIQTARAFATQHGPSAIATAEALATQYGPSAVETARALATEYGPSALGTAQAVATQYGPRAAATLQAWATEQGAGMVETAAAAAGSGASAVATLLASSGSEVPADIPLAGDELGELSVRQGLITYRTSLDFAIVTEFYKSEMAQFDWTLDNETVVISGQATVLKFEKDGRQATVYVTANPANQETILLIAYDP